MSRIEKQADLLVQCGVVGMADRGKALEALRALEVLHQVTFEEDYRGNEELNALLHRALTEIHRWAEQGKERQHRYTQLLRELDVLRNNPHARPSLDSLNQKLDELSHHYTAIGHFAANLTTLPQLEREVVLSNAFVQALRELKQHFTADG